MALLESLLFLSAEMEDGLGLLVASRPHGLIAAQLLQRVCDVTDSEMWEGAARRGHVCALRWLHDNFPTLDQNTWQHIARAAAQGGQVETLKWLASKYWLIVLLFAILG